MRNSELEAWVHRILRIVEAGGRVEDARVELKRSWPDPKPAARRLAGHLNAARGERALWVIGLDEECGVVRFDGLDTSEWLAQVRTQFDGLFPSVQDLVVPTGDTSVVAMLFSTDRAPFVVKNRAHGQPNGGPVTFEVPWRHGTAVRSARREDLIQLLVPLKRLPHLECLAGQVTAEHYPNGLTYEYGGPDDEKRKVPHCWWEVWLTLYVANRSEGLLVFPTHKASVSIDVGETIVASKISFSPPSVHTAEGVRHDSLTIRTTRSEALIHGPGRLKVRAATAVPNGYEVPSPTATARLSLRPAGEGHESVEVQCELLRTEATKGLKWSFDHRDADVP